MIRLDTITLLLIFIIVILFLLFLSAVGANSKLQKENEQLQTQLGTLRETLIEVRSKIQVMAAEESQKMFATWKEKELEDQKKLIIEGIEGQYKARFEEDLRKKSEEIQKKFEEQFKLWKETELKEKIEALEETLRKEYETKFQKWKQDEEEKIRRDAISRSTATILGRIGEQLSPILFFANYGINPKDVRFLGQPVDFIAFKGLEDGKLEEIIFIEVKSGKSKNLTPRERAIKKAIREKRVSWITFHTQSEIKKLEKSSM